MKIRFSKMHGLGNDFMVIDAISQTIRLTTEHIQHLANRHTGVGFDQLLLVESPCNKTTDFFYRIYNADGSEVEQCGNGARCFAKFIHDKQLSDKKLLQVETLAGELTLQINSDQQITVNMGTPELRPTHIPFQAEQTATTYNITLDNTPITFSALSLGNPHAVITVQNIMKAEVTRIGQMLQNTPRFPNSANIGFMEIINPHSIKLRVYERGAGETQACGSGACAAVVAGILQQNLQSPVNVNVLGGNLNITWAGGTQPILMTGPATLVYEGELSLPPYE